MSNYRKPGPARIGASTQEAHPWRASLRTAVQIIVPALILFVVAQPIIDEELGQHLPDAWRVWYAGAAAFLTACGVALTRLMALPAAQRLLEAIGLGTGVHAETRPLTAQERSDALTESLDLSGAAEDAYAADHPGRDGAELWDQDDETIDRYQARVGDA